MSRQENEGLRGPACPAGVPSAMRWQVGMWVSQLDLKGFGQLRR